MPGERQPGEGEIVHAAELVRAGKLVAFPTETVYGLGANAFDAAAVARIFEVKGRPAGSPIIVPVVDLALRMTRPFDHNSSV